MITLNYHSNLKVLKTTRAIWCEPDLIFAALSAIADFLNTGNVNYGGGVLGFAADQATRQLSSCVRHGPKTLTALDFTLLLSTLQIPAHM